MTAVVRYATAIEHGHPEKGWHGGRVPYSWAGGHAAKPGPTLGSCIGYTGSIHPCPADHTVGVDCSGFARWVYALAFRHDVLGPGSTNDELWTGHLHKVRSPRPGDLVYYGTSQTNTHHVGIYIGKGRMIDALKTGTNVETDSVHVSSDLLGYYHYTG
jgi:prepilin-type processing-associated H-X9-DG protein